MARKYDYIVPPGKHTLQFQCSIPATATRYAYQRMDGITMKALETLCRMVPRAYEIERKRKYRERPTRIGIMWDVLIMIVFRHNGPLPSNVEQLAVFAKIQQQIENGLAN